MSLITQELSFIEKQFKVLQNNKIVDQEYIAFLKEVSLLSHKYYLDLETTFAEKYQKKIEKNLKQSSDCLLERSKFLYDYDNTFGLFQELLELMFNQNNHLNVAAVKMKILVAENKIDIKKFFDSYINEEEKYFKDYLQYFDESYSVMFFLAYNSLLPSILLNSKTVLELSQYNTREISAYKACPVCGYPPYIGQLVNKQGNSAGELYHHCSFCKTQYRAKRLSCAYCGCEDQEKLGFYELEAVPNVQAFICDECKSYIKVFSADLPAEVIDIQSVSLDLAMESTDFKKMTASAFNI